MKILTYSPSIEVYAEANGEYYDLSPDVTNAVVSRRVDAASTFNVTLQNKNRKYNDVFSPMDKIVIYATKEKRHRLLTGYITKADKFTLYPSDFKMSGSCTFYQLQELFWDPKLIPSQKLVYLNPNNGAGYFDGGYWTVVSNLLMQVAGWPEDRIKIEQSIPSEVVDWAKGLYAAKQTDIEQARDMVNEFYDILHETSMKVTGDSASSGGSSSGQYDEGDANEIQRKIAEIAEHADQYGIPTTPDYCAMFVSMVYQKAGRPYPGGNAIDMWNSWSASGSTSMENIPVGSIVCGSGSGSMGAIYGHVGVYIGGGKVANNTGRLSIETLENWVSWQTATCQGHRGWIGWVFGNGEDLRKL